MHVDIAGVGKERFFFWNVDDAVGLNAPNQVDDVLFVSWCLFKMRTWSYVPEATRAVLRNAPITSECSGRESDSLVVAIKALQRINPAMMVDGRVSPAVKGGTYAYRGSNVMFLIFALNNALRMLHPQQYPRIDLMPDFAWRLKQAATFPFLMQ